MAEEKVLSRRNLLRGAGYSLAGLTLASSMGVFLAGSSKLEAAEDPAPPTYPWVYPAMDIEECKAVAYTAYKTQGG